MTTKQITIDGEYANLCQVNEFDKLKTLVSELCLLDNMSEDQLTRIYTKAFYDEHDTIVNINFKGISLDIHVDSENESDPKEEIQQNQYLTTNSPRKTRNKSIKKVQQNLLTDK